MGPKVAGIILNIVGVLVIVLGLFIMILSPNSGDAPVGEGFLGMFVFSSIFFIPGFIALYIADKNKKKNNTNMDPNRPLTPEEQIKKDWENS
jgi:hypothetical protein